MKTEWDLGLLYKNEKDPRINKDLETYRKAVESFEKKYKKDTKYLSNPVVLKKALEQYESLSGMPEAVRARMYFIFRKDLNGQDQAAESGLNKITDQVTKLENKIIFFTLNLGKIDKKTQKKLLGDKNLTHFKYFLGRIFKAAQYNLTEAEEKILSLKSLPAHEMWVSSQEKLLNNQTIMWKGKETPLPEAINKIHALDTAERRELHNLVMEKMKGVSFFAESEINAIYTDKKISDELRGLPHPYSATILSYQNDENSIIEFTKTVTKYFPISHRFYKLKSQLLKLKILEYADRGSKMGSINKKIPFDESLSIIRSAFSKLEPKYKEIFDQYLNKGQVDVFPKKGKSGGAYCWSNVNLPTYVLLNNTDSLDSVITYAHEMGHAFHGELGRIQTPLYQGHSTATAEVASTLFENFVFDEVFDTLSDTEKAIALHDRLNGTISTVFRQIACFNFELELHNVIREKGSVSKEEIAALLNKHMKAYLGPVFDLKENDGYYFVTWSHIRRFFYVYSYAYGQLISKALYKKYKEDKSFLAKIEQFLSAGESKSPEQIFKDIGIDTSKPEFFEAGLKSIEDDIKNLEQLTKKLKLV